MGDRSFLSLNLQTSLNQKGIFTLAQVRNISHSHSLSSYWKTSADMGFGADTEMEWDIFWLALADSCAILQETKDRLMWIGGDLSGVPSVIFFL